VRLGGPRASRSTARAAARVVAACDALLEAGWLAAAIVVPLFFNQYSTRIFEPDKLALLRSIALVMLFAWGLKLWALRNAGLAPAVDPRVIGRSLWREPLLLAVVALVAAYLLSTALSVNPRMSFWGSYLRSQGTISMLSYVTIFAAIAANLRRPAQLWRLVHTMILVGAVVGLYGIVQGLGQDPLPWRGGLGRVLSTFGNALFAGAYLVMVLPLTGVCLAREVRDRRAQGGWRAPATARTVGLACAGIVQLVGLWLTASRGPLVGLILGLWFLCLLLAAGRRLILTALLRSAGLALATFLFLNIPGSPAARLGDLPGTGRLGNLILSHDESVLLRLELWSGTMRMMTADTLVYPGGAPDPLAGLRLLVGYGPETMADTFSPFYSAAIGVHDHANVWDRPHNETLDALVIGGIPGIVTYLMLFAALLCTGLLALESRAIKRRRVLSLACMGGGAALGGLAALLLGGPSLIGIGLPAGLVLGLLVRLGVLLARARRDSWTPWQRGESLLAAGLLAGCLAHFAESQFGVAIGATWLYLWTYAALLFVIPRLHEDARPSVRTDETLVPSFISAALAVVLAYDFVGSGGVTTIAVAGLLVGSFAFGAALLTTAARPAIVLLGSGLSTGAVFSAGLLWVLGRGSGASQEAADVVSRADWHGLGYPTAAVALLALIVLIALGAGKIAVLEQGRLKLRVGWSWLGLGGSAIVLAANLSYAWFLRPIQGDMLINAASGVSAQGGYQAAAALQQQAVQLVPSEDAWRGDLAQSYLRILPQVRDAGQADALYRQALAQVTAAQQLHPLSADTSVNLARVEEFAAISLSDPAQAAGFARSADQSFAAAAALAPNRERLWAEWAALSMQTGDAAGALAKIERALKTGENWDAPQTYAVLGDVWARQAQASTDQEQRRRDFEQAVTAYERAGSLQGWTGAAKARQALGEPEQAADAYRHALALATTSSDRLPLLSGLVAAYQALGDSDAAVDSAAQGLSLAPPAEQALWRDVIRQVATGTAARSNPS